MPDVVLVRRVQTMDRPIMEVRGLTKIFPGVRALEEVDLAVEKGEVHALVGENGAGKSTLIKILGGIYTKSAGEITIEGQQAHIANPQQAASLGIQIIPQELILVEGLTVAENIFLGHEPGGHFVNFNAMRKNCKTLLDDWGIHLSPDDRVSDLSVAQSQQVLIAKALSTKAKLVIMDEPTARLTQEEVANLFEIVSALGARGITVMYISHHLEEIFQICDRVTVMRDGRKITTLSVSEVNIDQLISLMVGREIEDRCFGKRVLLGEELLRVEHLSDEFGILDDVTFGVREGEILGIAGLVGSGRSTLLRTIFGAHPVKKGRILVSGQEVKIRSPKEAVSCGMAFVPEERRAQGLILDRTVKENTTLANLARFCSWGLIDTSKECEATQDAIRKLSIRTPGVHTSVSELSGGNQQKVVIAKWLQSGVKVFFFDEPTRGIDVGAKAEIYRLMTRLAEKGAAIVMVSSELPEIIGISDRILVMKKGRFVAELEPSKTSEEEILSYAFGGEAGGQRN